MPLYWLAYDGDILARVFAVRQLSVWMAVGAVAYAYAIAREVFPERRALWAVVPLLVTLQPMFTLSTSTVNTVTMPAVNHSVIVNYDAYPIFADGFESGNTSAWSYSTP